MQKADAEKAEAKKADKAKKQQEAAAADAAAADKVYTTACDRFKVNLTSTHFDSPCATCGKEKKDHQAPEPKSKPLPKPPPTKAPAASAVRIPHPASLGALNVQTCNAET